jgi:hypothetical protein
MIARRSLLRLFALAPMIGGAAIVEACATPAPRLGKFYYEVTLTEPPVLEEKRT